MPSWLKQPRSRVLGALGDAVHSARLFIGLNVNDARGKTLRQLTPREAERLVETAAERGSGGLTVTVAQGRYIESGERQLLQFPSEQTLVFDLIVAGDIECAEFKSRVHQIAGEIARLGKQKSVLVLVECASALRDATYVDAKGKRRQALFPLR